MGAVGSWGSGTGISLGDLGVAGFKATEVLMTVYYENAQPSVTKLYKIKRENINLQHLQLF